MMEHWNLKTKNYLKKERQEGGANSIIVPPDDGAVLHLQYLNKREMIINKHGIGAQN